MRNLLALCFAFAVLPEPAFAKAHLWKFTEVFSNADGSVQFIEMFVFDPAGTAETQLAGFPLESNANTFIFPNNLPNENTFHTWILIATPAFAALPGAPTPDYVIPPGFFDPAGDELRYRTMLDILPLPAGAVPVDGIHSYLRDGTTAVNSPTNFAGVEGSIDVSRPCDDTLDNDGDGYADYPDDPACRDANWPRENAAVPGRPRQRRAARHRLRRRRVRARHRQRRPERPRPAMRGRPGNNAEELAPSPAGLRPRRRGVRGAGGAHAAPPLAPGPVGVSRRRFVTTTCAGRRASRAGFGAVAAIDRLGRGAPRR